jgi:hypothetical protein
LILERLRVVSFDDHSGIKAVLARSMRSVGPLDGWGARPVHRVHAAD